MALARWSAGVSTGAERAWAEPPDFCRGRLAHYKCPRRILLVDELPRSDAGKMQRRLLRERYRQEVTA